MDFNSDEKKVGGEMEEKSVKLVGKDKDTGCYIGDLYYQVCEDERIKMETFVGNEENTYEKLCETNFFYDPGTENVHLFPKDVKRAERSANRIEAKRKEIMRKLASEITSIKKPGWVLNGAETFKGFGVDAYVSGANGTAYSKIGLFRCIRVTVDKRKYDMVFIRFYKDDDNEKVNDKKRVHCILNCLQFVKLVGGEKAKSIYPTTAKDSTEEIESKGKAGESYYYNPFVSFYDTEETICKAFIKFIEENEKYEAKKTNNKITDFYVIQKSILSTNEKVQSKLLKLNRDISQLEVYRKVENDKLHEYYSIREDFDSSEYVMYEIERKMKCILGGEDSPTPTGIFRVEKICDEEYVSGYHSQYDKVKFFGYLVIFEDYFIHSNMYLEEVTAEMMRNGNAQTISKEDKCTAGCIRLAQEDVDWLLKEISVGTTIVM